MELSAPYIYLHLFTELARITTTLGSISQTVLTGNVAGVNGVMLC